MARSVRGIMLRNQPFTYTKGMSYEECKSIDSSWDRQVLALLATGAMLDETASALVDVLESSIANASCVSFFDLRDEHPILLANSPGFSSFPSNRKQAHIAITLAAVRDADLSEAIFICKPENDLLTQELAQVYRKHQIKSLWLLPVTSVTDKCIGVISICLSTSRNPSEVEWQVFEDALHLAGVAIENDSKRQSSAYLTQYYRTIVETINGILWESDPETHRLISVNQRAEHLLGHSLEEWLQNKAFWRNNIHPQDWYRVQMIRHKAVRYGGLFCYEYRFLRSDRSIVTLREEVTLVPQTNHRGFRLRGFAIDISNRDERNGCDTQTNFTPLF